MAMTESFDAPMMDFSGEDIPMQTSSSASWIHPEATMDDDSSFNLGGVEIDMENYHPETFEYEMTDDASAEQPIEVYDVEVIDVSQAHTPALIDTVVEDATVASPAVPEHDLTDTHDHSHLGTPPTLVIQVPSPTSQPAQDEEHHEIAAIESLERSKWEHSHSELPSQHPAKHQQLQNSAEPASREGATEHTLAWNVGAPVEHLQPEFTHDKSADDPVDRRGEDENPVPSHASSGDPHEVSDGIFIDPPPPVLLSLGDSEEGHYLFNRPAHKSTAADHEGATDNALFLHDLPTLYYEPLAKVFQALRLDDRLAQIFDISRGELTIDAYDLVDLVISEDNSYTNDISFHDLNLLHDHADLAGPLRIRVGCNSLRFITRYRELKSKLEQFNLLDEASADDAQLPAHDDPTEQLDAIEVPEYFAQDEEGDENTTSDGLNQAKAEQQTDDVGSGTRAVDRSDEGESSNEVESEQAQPADDEEYTTGPLSGDERTERPVSVAEGDHGEGTAAVTVSDSGYPGFAEDLNTAVVREHSDDRNTLPLGGNSAECEEVVATGEDYEANHNENDEDSELEETVAIEGDVRDGDWETTASDPRHTQDDLEQHEGQDDAAGMVKREQAVRITTADDLTLHATDSETIELITPKPDDDPITAHHGQQFPSAIACAPYNFTTDTDTDSIGQQTLDEFVDAQEESRDVRRLHEEGEESNSNTGERLFSASFPLTLTRLPDQSNELIPDLDQFGDDFNWDEDFGGDLDNGEFGEFEEQCNVETKRVDSQEPISGRSSKRGFDEIDSDTADEEETPGDASPNSKRKKVL
ncbi:hypothetical protein BDM02DRAFT_3183100 [Thelephora ganbajun]|uniref:Uncharacterized protein n=1 Tax=Thelephora ganbajun TaxID=370292 RepID=A0ACB6ZUS8_THEGA|nr:hypothetical protein BDM02DRAFT_3183100 [Thelephora ganbajun]